MGASSLLPTPPDEPVVTAYDRAHASLFLRLLDAEADGADWETAARLVLGQDVTADRAGAQRLHAGHLSCAHWLRDGGFFRLLSE
jgi:hypothetical protein